MARKIRIALAQVVANLGDVESNIKNATYLIENAARQNADVIVFPELCFTGYQLDILGKETCSLSDRYLNQIDDSMSAAAKKGNIYVIAGLGVRDKDDYYNAVHIYDRSGKLAGEYRKVFSFGKEGEYFSQGKDFPVFDTDFGKIGILICYDIGFPECARKLSNQGAEIIFIPSAWRIQDENAWNLNVPSRALENQCYTVGINHGGTFGTLRLFGRSLVCDPFGKPVLQLGYDEQMLGICDVDLDKVMELRNTKGYYQDYKKFNMSNLTLNK